MLALRNVLLANALSCLIFGALFILYPLSISQFLSNTAPIPTLLLSIVGGILLFNGLHLVWAARQQHLHPLWILYFSIGDILWVVSTVLTLILGLWVTSPYGVICAILVAAMVGIFGALQLNCLRASR